jgi:hypothetical protein
VTLTLLDTRIEPPPGKAIHQATVRRWEWGTHVGEVRWWPRRGKVTGGASLEKEMLLNDEQSRNVYENKQKDDALPEK